MKFEQIERYYNKCYEQYKNGEISDEDWSATCLSVLDDLMSITYKDDKED